jgi:hypothetical protein
MRRKKVVTSILAGSCLMLACASPISADNTSKWDDPTAGELSYMGRVGIGTATPTQQFHVKEKEKNVHPNIRVEDAKGDGIHVGYNTNGNFGALNSNTGGVFHWDTLTWKDDRVGIGGTPTFKNYFDGSTLKPRLDVHGQVRITSIPVWNGPSAYDLTWAKGFSNGVAYSPNKALISREGSSRRYKRGIQTADEDFAKILRVEVKSFQMQPGFGPPDARNIGYIAEDLDEAGLRNLVVYDEDGRPDGIRYKQVALYVNEVVKSQQKMIEQLQKEVAVLMRKVKELSRK